MGYTVSLTSGAPSQAEGSPGGTAASFTFTITRQAGDAATDGDNIQFKIVPVDGSGNPTAGVADDFAVNAGNSGAAGSGFTAFSASSDNLSATLTLTANADTTIEPNESFQVWINKAGQTNLLNLSTVPTITLLNDDAGPPVFSSPTAVNLAEGQTGVETVTSAGSGTPAYTITGGADSALFTISSAGVLTFNAAPDFEAGTGHGATANDYLVQVTSTAGGLATAQNLTVSVTNVDDVAPAVTSGATFTINENTTSVATMTATKDAAASALTWSISGGADASLFTIDANTGALSFVNKPDFENGTGHGAGGVNDYVVQVKATDPASLTATQTVDVNVANVVEGPTITSNGGVGFAVLHVQENTLTTTTIATEAGTKGDGAAAIVWSLTGPDSDGSNPNGLHIDAATGVITFAASPNYEAPADADGDNLYQVTVNAHGSVGPDATQTLFVFVDNVVEPGDPPIAPPNNGGGGVPTAPQLYTGTDGSESIAGSASFNDTISGAGGDDTIDGGSGDNIILGGDGNDQIRGFSGNDVIDGGAGNDDVNGNQGNDTVYGGDGADTVRGGQDNDSVYGGAGDDPHVNGNLGDDIVHGEDGNDTVYGGQGNDTVYGDAGNDQISGDLGNDILYGGPGADRFMFAKGGGQDWIADFNAAEGDHIVLPTGTTYTVLNFAGQALIMLSSGDSIGLAGVAFSSFSSDWIQFA